ncbi:MAG TPA: type II toxin-antitoxin system VapC family toxin [Mucilaginibacter sp.]
MKIFLDTSSLIKLYFKEEGTSKLDQLFVENIITEIYISEITKVEFFSAIYKKLRTGDLQLANVNDIINAFTADEHNYSIILIDREIVNFSQKLIEKYGVKGLRSLDAIQFASAYSVRNAIDFAISDDKLLNTFLLSEGMRISADGI